MNITNTFRARITLSSILFETMSVRTHLIPSDFFSEEITESSLWAKYDELALKSLSHKLNDTSSIFEENTTTSVASLDDGSSLGSYLSSGIIDTKTLSSTTETASSLLNVWNSSSFFWKFGCVLLVSIILVISLIYVIRLFRHSIRRRLLSCWIVKKLNRQQSLLPFWKIDLENSSANNANTTQMSVVDDSEMDYDQVRSIATSCDVLPITDEFVQQCVGTLPVRSNESIREASINSSDSTSSNAVDEHDTPPASPSVLLPSRTASSSVIATLIGTPDKSNFTID